MGFALTTSALAQLIAIRFNAQSSLPLRYTFWIVYTANGAIAFTFTVVLTFRFVFTLFPSTLLAH